MQQPSIRASGHKLIPVAKSGHNSCIMFQSKVMRDILFDKLTTGEPYTNDRAGEAKAGEAKKGAADQTAAKGNQLEKHGEPEPSSTASGETMSAGETWSNSVSLSSSTAPSVLPSALVFDRLNDDAHPSDAFAAAAFMAASATEGIGAAARKAIAAAAASATPSSA